MNDAEMRIRKDRLYKEEKHVTSKVSELVRLISIGVLAADYTIIVSNSKFAIMIMNESQVVVLISATFAAITIFSEYLQFLCGYIAVRSALNNHKNEYAYDMTSISYKCRRKFYVIKQVTLIVSILLFITVLLKSMVT